MRGLFKALISVGTAVAAITGTTIAVKKNNTCKKAFERLAPTFAQTQAVSVREKALAFYRSTSARVNDRVGTFKAHRKVTKSEEFTRINEAYRAELCRMISDEVTRRKAR
jgi:hypothetical protein